jgi:hypothetical protein
MVRRAAACDDGGYRQGGVDAHQTGRQPGRGLASIAGAGLVRTQADLERMRGELIDELMRDYPPMTREEATKRINAFF